MRAGCKKNPGLYESNRHISLEDERVTGPKIIAFHLHNSFQTVRTFLVPRNVELKLSSCYHILELSAMVNKSLLAQSYLSSPAVRHSLNKMAGTAPNWKRHIRLPSRKLIPRCDESSTGMNVLQQLQE